MGLHDILNDSDLVCRSGACSADSLAKGSGVVTGAGGKLSGISTQAKPGADLTTLSQPFCIIKLVWQQWVILKKLVGR